MKLSKCLRQIYSMSRLINNNNNNTVRLKKSLTKDMWRVRDLTNGCLSRRICRIFFLLKFNWQTTTKYFIMSAKKPKKMKIKDRQIRNFSHAVPNHSCWCWSENKCDQMRIFESNFVSFWIFLIRLLIYIYQLKLLQ